MKLVYLDGEKIPAKEAAQALAEAGLDRSLVSTLEPAAFSDKGDGDKWGPSTYKSGPRKNAPCMRHSVTGKARDMTPAEKEMHGGGTPSLPIQPFSPPSPPVAPPPESPRAQAEAAIAKSDDYAFARESAIPNLGEDVGGSARHVRNRWRGLAQAEADGSAQEMVKRDVLFKTEPHALMAGIRPDGANALATLAAHLCLNTFPAEPRMGKDPRHPPELMRSQYLDTYRAVKAEAEAAALTETDPARVMARVHGVINKRIEDLRGMPKGTPYYGGTDRSNPTANSLIDSYKRTKPQSYSHWYKKTSVGGRLLEFAGKLKAKYGDVSAAAEKLTEHVKDVLEGESFNSTFGTTKEGGAKFDPADLYVKHATRVGGPVIDASTVSAGLAYVGDVLGMRGLQWGNSVSDEERQHHLQKAAESFADLTDVLGLPPEMASHGGKLALAIGARGKGSSLATYEPMRKVINLTRKGGVGSLAHEWGHSLDHVLAGGGINEKGGAYLSQSSPSTRWAPSLAGSPVGTAMSDLIQSMRSCGFSQRLSGELSADRSKHLLSDKMTAYWGSAVERFARCFERHVQRKLQAQGRQNTYLSGVKPHKYWPTDEETDAMMPAFDRLMAAAREAFLTRPPQAGASAGAGGLTRPIS